MAGPGLVPAPLLVESAVGSIQTLMRQQFNLNLAKVWNQFSDQTGVDRVNLPFLDDDRFFISEAIEPLKVPSVFIVADNSEHDLSAQNVAFQRHRVLVAILVEAIEITQLVRTTWRYGDAAFLTLHDAATGNIKILVRRVNYSPIIARTTETGRQFRKDITLELEVLHFEAL